MKLYPSPFVVSVSLVATTVFAGSVDPARLLVPGKQAGSIRIGENAETVYRRLGKEDSGDGAMGRFTSTYIGKAAPHYRLDIYSHRVFPRSGKDMVIVDTVRVESPYFRTENGVAANSLWNTVQARYPKIHPVAWWDSVGKSPQRRCTVYDDTAQGIGFERIGGSARISALYIHTPGKPLQPLGHDDPKIWRAVEL